MNNSCIRTVAAACGLAAILLSGGCATCPVPKEVRQSVSPGVSFGAVLQDPAAFQGRIVLWSGPVLAVSNGKEGTRLEILQVPVDAKGRPEGAERSEGRFLADFDRYLDPAVYAPGRWVTVAGPVQGKESRPLAEGKMDYGYPLLKGTYLHLWPVREKVANLYPYGGWYGPGYWGPGWDPFYYPPPVIVLHEHERGAPPRAEPRGGGGERRR